MTKKMSRSTERKLLERAAKGDKTARIALIISLEPFVYGTANRWPCKWVPMEVLLHECKVALIEAVDDFDPSFYYGLSTYAGVRIKGRMWSCTERYRGCTPVPFHDSWRKEHLDTRRHGLWHEHGPKPSFDKILGENGSSELEASSSCSGYLPRPKSGRNRAGLEVDPEGAEIVGFLVDESDTEENAIRSLEMSYLREALELLPDRLRLVIQKRHGLDGYERHTLKVLAEEMSISRERVRQLQKEAEGSLALMFEGTYILLPEAA